MARRTCQRLITCLDSSDVFYLEKNAYLVMSRSLFGQSENRRHADSQMVSTDVVNLSLLHERPDIGLLQMLNLVFVGGSKVGDHATIVAGDDHATFSSRLSFVDAVFDVDASLFAGLSEDIGVLVFADTANVHDGVFGEDVLRQTGALEKVPEISW